MNANNPNNNSVGSTEEQIEKLFKSAPMISRDPKADKKFYMELLKLAQTAQSEEKVVFNFWQTFMGSFRKMNFAYSAITALIVVFVGGTALAYQPGTVYGDLLYGWKTAGEKIELAFASTPTQQVNTYLKFSDRRFNEAQTIMANKPSLVSLIPTAQAHDASNFISLSGSDEYKLEHTLSDMCQQIELASKVIEEKITDPAQAQTALASLETLTEKQRTHLSTVNKKVKKPTVQKIVVRFINQEDLHLARSLVAKEQAQKAIVLNVKVVNIKMKLDGEQNAKFADEINIQAADNVRNTVNMFNNMQIQNREVIQKQIEMAKQALEEGKFGRAHGLSQALSNQMADIKLNPEMEIYFQRSFQIPGQVIKVPELKSEKKQVKEQKIELQKFTPQKNTIREKSVDNEKRIQKPEQLETLENKDN